MKPGDELPEGLSADDLTLTPGAQPSSRPHEHVHPSPPSVEDHGFDHTHADHHPVDHPHEIHHTSEVEPSLKGLSEGWELGLYRDAIVGGALAGAALATLGVFIVLRRAVFAAASVGQAASLGVVLAFYSAIHWGLELPPLLGALLCAALTAAALARRQHKRRLPRDATLGVAFLVASAGAVALGDRITQEAHEVSSILFGTAVIVSGADVIVLALLFVAVVGLTAATWRGVAFAGFDPEGAVVQGLPVRALDLGFWAAVATAVAVGTHVLGALPVFAFSVLPALGAIVCTSRLGVTLVVSAVLGASSAAVGYVLAYFLALPVGATQTLCAGGLLGLCAVYGRVTQKSREERRADGR